VAGDWDQVREIYVKAGENGIGNRMREIRDFYETDADCLWITFGQGRLWWAFASPEVELMPDGARRRRTLAPWSCLDAAGEVLAMAGLSTRLTQTASYQMTICTVAAEAYLLRRVNAQPDSIADRLDGLTAELRELVAEMIADLHWRDFETLIDLIFTRGGWRRVTPVGGSSQADSDIILEQPVTGERAFVQIKSKATQATLRDYRARFEAYPDMHRFYFACHSPNGRLTTLEDDRAEVWLAPQIAARAIEGGLVEWLMEKRR
jgi:hypothetical protein